MFKNLATIIIILAWCEHLSATIEKNIHMIWLGGMLQGYTTTEPIPEMIKKDDTNVDPVKFMEDLQNSIQKKRRFLFKENVSQANKAGFKFYLWFDAKFLRPNELSYLNNICNAKYINCSNIPDVDDNVIQDWKTWYEFYRDSKQFALAADIARFVILYKYGGLYTDFKIVLKELPNLAKLFDDANIDGLIANAPVTFPVRYNYFNIDMHAAQANSAMTLQIARFMLTRFLILNKSKVWQNAMDDKYSGTSIGLILENNVLPLTVTLLQTWLQAEKNIDQLANDAFPQSAASFASRYLEDIATFKAEDIVTPLLEKYFSSDNISIPGQFLSLLVQVVHTHRNRIEQTLRHRFRLTDFRGPEIISFSWVGDITPEFGLDFQLNSLLFFAGIRLKFGEIQTDPLISAIDNSLFDDYKYVYDLIIDPIRKNIDETAIRKKIIGSFLDFGYASQYLNNIYRGCDSNFACNYHFVYANYKSVKTLLSLEKTSIAPAVLQDFLDRWRKNIDSQGSTGYYYGIAPFLQQLKRPAI